MSPENEAGLAAARAALAAVPPPPRVGSGGGLPSSSPVADYVRGRQRVLGRNIDPVALAEALAAAGYVLASAA